MTTFNVTDLKDSQPVARILIVDDSAEEQRRLLEFLRFYHMVPTMAFDGHQGYQRAVATQPDLILLDVRMPKMDGFAACRLLKADPLTREIPVIFLTSANAADERIEGLTLGAVDYVCKPFAAEEVLARIRIHLNLSQRIRASESSMQAELPSVPMRSPNEVKAAATMRLISQHLHAPMQLAEIARAVGTTEKKLTRVFREQTGFTVSAYVREERIALARRLLAETDLSVQDIANETGFQSPANFATAFRERMGMPPSVYRQAMQKGMSTDAE